MALWRFEECEIFSAPALRKGDKLMQINDIDLQDLTPEELTQMLAEGTPKLVSAEPSGDFVKL